MKLMWSWIIVGVLYLLGMGLFQLLGGLGAAGEGFRRWGESASALRNRTSPTS
jgi:hypothetical protein